MSAHRTCVAKSLTVLLIMVLVKHRFSVVPFKTLETALMKHVGTVQKNNVFQVKSIVADWAVLVASLKGLNPQFLPEFRQLHASSIFFLFFSLPYLLFFHDSVNIWHETL